MLQTFTKSLRLRLCALVALVLCAAGSAWGEDTILLSENFAEIKTGNSTSTSGSSTAWQGNDNFPKDYLRNAYQAGGAVRIGSSSQYGGITSKTLNVSVGTLTVAFDVKGWASKEGNIKVTVGTQNQIVEYNNTMSSSFESKSVTFDISVASSTTVKIETTAKRAFLDNIVISNTESSTPSLTASNLALTGAPIELSFDLYDNSSAQTISYNTSSTGAVTVNGGTGYVTTSVDETNKTISVTPTAVTPSAQTITVSQAADDTYEAGSVTFTVSIANSDPNLPGRQGNPYTVAQARAAIDADTGTSDVYVRGIVSQVDQFNSNYNSITYWISDDGTKTNQFEVYSGKGIDGADFESINDVQVGDVVVVKGNIKKYNSTYEFDYNNQLVSLNRKATPTLSFDQESYSVVKNGSLTITATSNSDGAVTYESSDTDVAEIDATTGEVTAKTAGTATITASVTGDVTASCIITVTESGSSSSSFP